MYYIDYHTHTKLSPDGEVPLAAMAEAAVQAGLTELCVTDHYDLVDLEGKPEPNGYDWVPALEQWRETAERYRGRLTIRLGMEFGSANRYPDRARATLDQPELDFVIGSLHNLTPEAGAKDFYFVDYTAPEVCYACPSRTTTPWDTSSTRCGICACGTGRLYLWTGIGSRSGRSYALWSRPATPWSSTPTTAAPWPTGCRC